MGFQAVFFHKYNKWHRMPTLSSLVAMDGVVVTPTSDNKVGILMIQRTCWLMPEENILNLEDIIFKCFFFKFGFNFHLILLLKAQSYLDVWRERVNTMWEKSSTCPKMNTCTCQSSTNVFQMCLTSRKWLLVSIPYWQHSPNDFIPSVNAYQCVSTVLIRIMRRPCRACDDV